MTDCIICKIISGEIPTEKIYEDEHTTVFLDINPSSPGHSVVTPKKHGLSILDFNEHELGKIMLTVQRMSGLLEKVLHCDAITIGINHKEKKGLPHLHIHLIPRWENDNGGALQSVVKSEPDETRSEIAQKIRNELE
jgi:histidine triad (HIT) family protein